MLTKASMENSQPRTFDGITLPHGSANKSSSGVVATCVRLKFYVGFIAVFNILSIVSPYVFVPLLSAPDPICYNVSRPANHSSILLKLDEPVPTCSATSYLEAVEQSQCYPEETLDLHAICRKSDTSCCSKTPFNDTCRFGSAIGRKTLLANSRRSDLLVLSAMWAGTIAITAFMLGKGWKAVFLLLVPVTVAFLWVLIPIKINGAPNYTFFVVVISGLFNVVCGMYDWRFFRLLIPTIPDSLARMAAAMVCLSDICLQLFRLAIGEAANVPLSIVFVCIAYQWYYIMFYWHAIEVDEGSNSNYKTRQLVICLTILVWYYIGMFLFVTHFTVVYFLFAVDAGLKIEFTVIYVILMRAISLIAEGLGDEICNYVETESLRLKILSMIAYLNGLYYYVFYFNLFTRIVSMQTFIFLHICDIVLGT
jgi:hypothetical protein